MADVRRELLEKSRRQAKRRQRLWLMLFVILLISILVGTVFFLRWEEIRISTISVSGNKVVKTEDLDGYIKTQISGMWFWVIPKNNSLFINKLSLGQGVRQQFPDISKLEIKRVGFNKLDLKVYERSPKFLWCQSGEIEKCFYVDETGFIFAEAPNFSGNILFKIYGLLSQGPVGSRPIARSSFVGLVKIIDTLPDLFRASGLDVAQSEKLLIDKYGDCRVTVIGLSSGNDWQFIFHYQQDLSELASNLNTIFNSSEFKADKASLGSLDYIDLRFGKKVFYKFK